MDINVAVSQMDRQSLSKHNFYAASESDWKCLQSTAFLMLINKQDATETAGRSRNFIKTTLSNNDPEDSCGTLRLDCIRIRNGARTTN